MRTIGIIIALPLLLAACSGSNENASEQALENAAEQSDPAAAAVLENAAENGMDPQQALEQAGEAQAPPAPPKASAQARPNTAQNPNPVKAGQPPEKVVTNTAADEHADHNGH